MARQETGGTLSVATLGGVVVVMVIAVLNWRQTNSLHQALNQRLDELDKRVVAAASQARAVTPQPQQGPDPNRAYKVKTDGAPVKGPVNAPVTIAEWSDFQ